MAELEKKAHWPTALRISGIYVFLASIYVLGLDYVLDVLVLERDAIVFWQQVKGGGFVALTGAFLFVSLLVVLRERSKQEQRIQNEQDRLYTVLETIPAYVYLQGQDSGIRYANKEFREKFGDGAHGPRATEAQEQDELRPFHAPPDAFEQAGPRTWEFYDDRSRRSYEIHDVPMRDVNGEMVVLEMGFDITHRIKTEQTLRQLSVVVEQSPVSIVITDARGHIEYVNPKFEEVTGYSKREVLGENPRILKSGEQDPELYSIMWQTLLDGEVWQGELCNKRKDGSLLYERATISPIRDQHGKITHYIGLKQDVSELQAMVEKQQELESQYRQAQKLEALGTLAGGIAHDFNNILSAILGFSELALMNLKEGDPLHGDLEQIHSAGIRARDLVRQILTFSRAGDQERHPVRIELVAKEALKLLRSTLPATIEIQQDFQADNTLVLADPTQMHQVFMNLCTNAYQAMGEQGGILSVSIGRQLIEGKRAKRLNVTPGTYVMIGVSDTGCGIPDGLREKIFDPFFTTKDVGKGTGLGLSTVHGIVVSHGGGIELVTKSGEGSSFHLFFPEVEDSETVVTTSEKPLRGGHESILLVDDETAIVLTLQRRLALLGYRVTTCESPLEALRLFEDKPRAFDLLVTDQVMAEMTGTGLARKLREFSPHLPVVAITGHSEQVTAESAEDLGFDGFLLKPIEIKHLAETVRNILDKACVKQRLD